MTDRTLHLPSCVLRRVGFDARRGRHVVVSVGIVDGERFAAVLGFGRETAAGDVPIALQNFFRCHFGIFPEEGRIAEDGLQILRNLGTVLDHDHQPQWRWEILTSHIVSLYVISALTASMAMKLSSTVPFLTLG